MALAADEAAHLLPRGHGVDVVVLDALGRFEHADPFQESGTRHAKLHGLGIVAVDAGHRMRDVLPRFGVGEGIELCESRYEVAVAGFLIGDVHRCVAMDAGAGLLGVDLAFRELLVGEHVRVAALFAEVVREGIAGPHGLEPRVFFEPRLRDDRSRIGLRRSTRDGLAAAVARADLIDGAAIAVVLQREVLSQIAGSTVSSSSSTTR